MEGKMKLTIARIKELMQEDTQANRLELAEMFWDWWGDIKTLPNKAFRFCKPLLRLVEALKLDDSTEVDLKENCPGDGSLYVSCQLHKGETMLAWFTPASGHSGEKDRSQLVRFWAGQQLMTQAPNMTELLKKLDEQVQR
jgi:hypothetical protein